MMYLAFAACCVLTNLFLGTLSTTGSAAEIINGILLLIDFALFVAIIVLTVVVCIERFYKNCYGPEGYLTFTLPVKPWQILLSKTLSSALLIICTLAVICGGVLLAVPFNTRNSIDMSDMVAAFEQGLQAVGAGNSAGLALNILGAVARNLFVTILAIYLAISIGQLFHDHKVALSFVFFFVIQSVIGLLTSLLFAGTMNMSDILSTYQQSVDSLDSLIGMINTFIGLQSLWMMAIAAAMFFGTDYIMRKHLNLE